MADGTDALVVQLRNLILEVATAEPAEEHDLLVNLADRVSELDLRLSLGCRLPTDWLTADRRRGEDRRGRLIPFPQGTAALTG